MKFYGTIISDKDIVTKDFVQTELNAKSPAIQSTGNWRYRVYDDGFFEAWGLDALDFVSSDFVQDGSLYSTAVEQLVVPFSAMGIPQPSRVDIHCSVTGESKVAWVGSCRMISSGSTNYINYKITTISPNEGLAATLKVYCFGTY